MPTRKYIELDSNYRNRHLYPNPGEFGVDISQSGVRGQSNALDPITLGYPQITFCPNDLNTQTAGIALNYVNAPSTNSALTAASSPTTLIVEYQYAKTGGVSFPTDSGYLVGSVLNYTNSSDYQVRRIVAWKFLKNRSVDSMTMGQFFQCEIESAFSQPSLIASSATFKVYNPTDLVTQNNIFVYIPLSLSIPNFYNRYILYDINTNSYAPIQSYDMTTHLANFNLSGITGSTGPTGPTWDYTDTFVVRTDIPRQYGNKVGTAPVDISVTGNTINLGFTWNETYLNNFIAIYQNKKPSIKPLILQITGFATLKTTDPTTGKVTITYTDYAYVQNADGSSSFTVTNTKAYWEILNFNTDNVSPFVYTGTMASQNQAVAYEVSLVSLTLPNVPLINGGRIAYYPFVYVELENNSSSSSGTKNLIYSNNPNTYKAVFKIPITDLNHPLQSPFVKLTGNGMNQTMVFKQNDDMRVSVRLPNGDVFQPATPDNSYGNITNPLLQVSFLFGVEKI
jgi:hypothetical protein